MVRLVPPYNFENLRSCWNTIKQLITHQIRPKLQNFQTRITQLLIPLFVLLRNQYAQTSHLVQHSNQNSIINILIPLFSSRLNTPLANFFSTSRKCNCSERLSQLDTLQRALFQLKDETSRTFNNQDLWCNQPIEMQRP